MLSFLNFVSAKIAPGQHHGKDVFAKTSVDKKQSFLSKTAPYHGFKILDKIRILLYNK